MEGVLPQKYILPFFMQNPKFDFRVHLKHYSDLFPQSLSLSTKGHARVLVYFFFDFLVVFASIPEDFSPVV